MEYSFADVLGGMHVFGVGYKLLEHKAPRQEYAWTESLLLVGELVLSSPAKYVTLGVGVDIF
jgi:hypothetical protein